MQAVLILVFLVYQTGFAQNNPPPMSFGCAIDSVQMPSLPENFQYICTDPSVVKYIRVNIHYMLKGDILGFTVNTCNQSIDYKGYGNFTPYSNGFNSGQQSGQVPNFDLTDIYDFTITSGVKYYKVKLTVGNSSCLPNHSFEKVIKVTGCLTGEGLDKIVELWVINPVSQYLNALYTLHQAGDVQIVLVNVYSGQTSIIESANSKVAGDYYLSYPICGLPNGPYS